MPAKRHTAGWLILLCLCVPALHAAPPAPAKPNVLFIAIDDLNDYISPLANHPGVKTPNFDRLAKRSVTFANAHCAAPACHPSRVAVMTGVHPAKSGIYVNLFDAHGPRWRQESPVLKDAVVLSQHFRDHGYRAVGGGKIFHTLQWTPGDSQNDPAAWDAYRSDPLDPISKDWVGAKFESDPEMGIGPGRPLGPTKLFGAAPLSVPDEQTGDHMVVDWAIGEMRVLLFIHAPRLSRDGRQTRQPATLTDLYPSRPARARAMRRRLARPAPEKPRRPAFPHLAHLLRFRWGTKRLTCRVGCALPVHLLRQ